MTRFIYTPATPRATKTPLAPSRRHCRSFSRQAVFDAFGQHHGKAIDQAGFTDHPPGTRMRQAPDSWFQA